MHKQRKLSANKRFVISQTGTTARKRLVTVAALVRCGNQMDPLGILGYKLILNTAQSWQMASMTSDTYTCSTIQVGVTITVNALSGWLHQTIQILGDNG
jgi:hypothetical protein